MRRSLPLLFLAACEAPITTTTITDEGTACVNSSGEVEVTFEGCLSSSCDTLVSATCTAELVGDVVEVHAEAVVQSQGDECTADCGIIQATCALPTIENPDTTEISFGGSTAPLDAACPNF